MFWYKMNSRQRQIDGQIDRTYTYIVYDLYIEY